MEKEEIEKRLSDIQSYIDYEVGDWVETCNLLPGIVQQIDVGYVESEKRFKSSVKIFYPHMAFDLSKNGEYHGGSNCSVVHCGVHKIDPLYAVKLMSLGYDRLYKLYEEWRDEDEYHGDWDEKVNELYEKTFNNK